MTDMFKIGDKVKISTPRGGHNPLMVSTSFFEKTGFITDFRDDGEDQYEVMVPGIDYTQTIPTEMLRKVEEECDWPTDTGFYFVRGEDVGVPVSGFTLYDGDSFDDLFGNFFLGKNMRYDRLIEATRLVSIPVEMWDKLKSTLDEISAWRNDHSGADNE